MISKLKIREIWVSSKNLGFLFSLDWLVLLLETQLIWHSLDSKLMVCFLRIKEETIRESEMPWPEWSRKKVSLLFGEVPLQLLLEPWLLPMVNLPHLMSSRKLLNHILEEKVQMVVELLLHSWQVLLLHVSHYQLIILKLSWWKWSQVLMESTPIKDLLIVSLSPLLERELLDYGLVFPPILSELDLTLLFPSLFWIT